MSRVGNPYDNAKAESFMATLKREQIDGRAYRDLAEARADLGAFIDAVYNRERLHSALGYRSPDEFEAWQQTSLRPSVARPARPEGSAPATPNPLREPQTKTPPKHPVSP